MIYALDKIAPELPMMIHFCMALRLSSTTWKLRLTTILRQDIRAYT